ncbi:DUF4157 domain-containing protein [Rhodococcus spelaei]|uniref:DUF4157 domain-containing protein n=1 Tax=Rhodococcus spelaei TaxID=2546320 RepID=A0A541B7J7_9NOCA|nr:DUF4157 domain-containing protein [Rhodococcus spelaei]TQF68268.1 DUF4157 domain-containing protein [Rhodococcus spelaei]
MTCMISPTMDIPTTKLATDSPPGRLARAPRRRPSPAPVTAAVRPSSELLPGLQTKLAINKPGDAFEQEADRVAEKIMRMPDTQLQRTCACGGAGSGEDCHCKKLAEGVQRSHSGSNAAETSATAPAVVHKVLNSPGEPLSATARDYLEPRFGRDFAAVRIHTDTTAAESTKAVDAQAYTVGHDVVFGPGQYAPHTECGRLLLAHEMAHVVQQAPDAVGNSGFRQTDANTNSPGTVPAINASMDGYSGHRSSILQRQASGSGSQSNLHSRLFLGDARLEKCLHSDQAHVLPGAAGDHVQKIQTALETLDKATIAADEKTAINYGATTAAAVLKYKTTRKIINYAYQQQPDNIVGKMTIRSMDDELAATPPSSTHLEFVIVAKSFIRPIGGNIGTPRCSSLLLPVPAPVPVPVFTTPIERLTSLAAVTDFLFSETAPDDKLDKAYRLFSRVHISMDCAPGNPPSVQVSGVETDHGSEGWGKLKVEPPALTVFGVNHSDGHLSWSVKGRPALAVEGTFQLVCPRTSRFIWHHVDFWFDCNGVKLTALSGSQFPTHRLYVDGAVRTTIPQGVFENLWIPASDDPNIVK